MAMAKPSMEYETWNNGSFFPSKERTSLHSCQLQADVQADVHDPTVLQLTGLAPFTAVKLSLSLKLVNFYVIFKGGSCIA